MTGYVLLAIASAGTLAILSYLVFRGVRIWRDAGSRGLSARQKIGWAMIGALLPGRYWWEARIAAMSPEEQRDLLAQETAKLGLSRAGGQVCPLCGAEIARAWALTAAGEPGIAPGPVECPSCDFRLDACRHCARFLPGSPRGWTGFSFSENDTTYGRCSFYKKVQPVEQAAAPDVARLLKSRGYDRISAPMPIQDSMMRPDSCRAFTPDRKRIEASGLRWPEARRVALLRLQDQNSGAPATWGERPLPPGNP